MVPFLSYAYYLSGSVDLPPIKDQLNRDDWSRPLATAFARFAADLHKRGILHHDLNSTNTLYHERADGSYSFAVIDINRMAFSAPATQTIDDQQGGTPQYRFSFSLAERIENLTRFTGRIDLFEHVARQYALCLGLDPDAFAARAVAQKKRHDRRWVRRKRISHIFKHKRASRKA